MCGIVAYFGGAENPLARILTGMWSIIYRAPDSTGMAMFGDETTPVRTRKSLGSVADLVEVLYARPMTLRSGTDLLGMLSDPSDADEEFREARKRLLRLEGFLPEKAAGAVAREREVYLTWGELSDPGRSRFLDPGTPGRPGAVHKIVVHSRRDLQRTIENLMFWNDLPPLVVRSVFHNFLSRKMDEISRLEELPVDPSEVVSEFDRLFESITDYEGAPRAQTDEQAPDQPEGERFRPAARRYLWGILLRNPIDLPVDYDPDGVRRLFCCLDSLVISRVSSHPDLDERLHREMTELFQQAGRNVPAPWQTLYRAERALNVYGMAAAAVYRVLLRETAGAAGVLNEPEVPGRTDSKHLAMLVQPVVAHGRWALQSQVTLRNTHPFVDQQRLRCACINGQFSSEVEGRVHRFLTKVAGVSLRSENSTEYFSQLWGYYARILWEEKNRNESIRQQVSLGLDDLAAGSHNIDYQIFYRLREAGIEEIEEMAFIRAMQVMIQDGGQVAVAGMSLLSPHRLYAASHNRPLFIVRRKRTGGIMLVSDVNAALGLFSQRQIQKSARKLQNDHPAKDLLLKQFEVIVTPLQGEELFVRMDNRRMADGIHYRVRITDFQGREQSDIEPFLTRLSPVQIKRSLNRTFYETHLREIPELIGDLLETYLPAGEAPDISRFGVNRRLLNRRFGTGLSSLSRLFLVGMGSSYHVAGMAKSMVRSLVPGLPVVVSSPVEVDDIARTMNPDRDLVVCASWSGTTADMVQFAKDLHAQNVVAVGVTEKPFSDMALVLQKSGGVIPVHSGEEVTVSAVKSMLCMLFGLEGFCLALLAELGHREKALFLASRMHSLPEKIRQVLDDEALRNWSRRQSEAHNHSICHLVLDTRHSLGTGPEIALKLEENSWYSMGKTFDFRDVEAAVLDRWDAKNLVLVNATNMVRLQEALACMKRLHAAGVEYALVSFDHEYLEHMRELGAPEPALLPKVDDMLQPFVDLVFYLQLGLDYGMTHGRLPGEFPRNRAKSVTAGRSRPPSAPGPGRDIAEMARKNENWSEHSGFRGLIDALAEPSAWENRRDVMDWESAIYRDMRLLCDMLLPGDALERLIEPPDRTFSDLAGFVMDQLSVDGEIVLVPLDKAAEAASRTLSKHWAMLLECFIRIESPAARIQTAGGDRLVILLAVEEPEDYILEKILPDLEDNFLWIGPHLEEYFARVFMGAGGYAPLRPEGLHCRQDLLYAAASLFFTRILRQRRPERAEILQRHFGMAGLAVSAMLNDEALYRQIAGAADADRNYGTALFIGPATGNGPAWVRRFDRHGKTLMECYDFGFAAHGPLVTVDNRVADKFVSLTGRQAMEASHGVEKVRLWGEKYFPGRSLEEIPSRPETFLDRAPVSPFYAQKQWFLPELREDYDCSKDNAVMIDATSERAFGQALDELATFGCRFARMTVISQKAFAAGGRLSAFNPHPISHLLLLPDLGEPVSDLLLPFVQTLLAAAMAAATGKNG